MNIRVNITKRSGKTFSLAAKFQNKLQIALASSPSRSILTPDQPVLTMILQ